MRTFEEILEDEKKKRNTLTIKLTKIINYEDGKEIKAPSLNIEDMSELIFDVIKLEMKNYARLALTTSRYNTKVISLKPEVDPTNSISKAEDFPALGPNKIAADGFEHMVEVVESEPNTAEEKMIKKDNILKVGIQCRE